MKVALLVEDESSHDSPPEWTRKRLDLQAGGKRNNRYQQGRNNEFQIKRQDEAANQLRANSPDETLCGAGYESVML